MVSSELSIADRALHRLAEVCSRVTTVRRATRLVRACAAMRPRLDVDSAQTLEFLLRPRGTCLSRAMVVASRLPGAALVIGAHRSVGSAMRAHAWVSLPNETLFHDGLSVEIVRIP